MIIKELSHLQIAFPAIKELELQQCNNLKYVFTSSAVKSFEQLKTLVIESCDKIEEVISVTQGLVEEERVVFPKLEFLRLSFLYNLKRFCCGSPIEFPSLKELMIWNCDVLSTFHCDCTNTVAISMDHNLRTQSLFNHKVAFPAIKLLKLYGHNNLKYVFTSSTVKSFVQLKTLQIIECDEIEEVISITQGLVEEERVVFPKLEDLLLSHLPNLERFCCGCPIEFPSLKTLYIRSCDVLSTFHCDCTSTVGKSSNIPMDHNLRTHIRLPQSLFNHKVALPMLEDLNIMALNLVRLWPNQLADESYPKLIQLMLVNCDKLLNVFPLSMSTRLQRLNRLRIWDCELLEEIFEPQQDHNSFIKPISPTIEFPQVTYLELIGLPKLKGFYHERHTTNWSSLKHMEVYGCDKVEILFASHEKMEMSQQPLFWVNKFTFPNLELLELGPNDGMKEIWHACGQQQLVTDYLCKLKDVQVRHIPKKFAIIPLYFLQLLSLPNLETLEIRYVDCKEIFPSEGVGGEEMPASAWVVLSRVTELRLTHLSELMHLWNEKEGFQNLRILEVEECPKLKNYLVPSSVSFQNLVTLLVQKCGGITELITHSTAKTLVQLKEMSITDCDKMNEIIEGSGDDEDELKIEISFLRLHSLELRNLPKLESFCSSGNYSFAFPSLEEVKVEDCPKMKMFSQGDSNTPMLHKYYSTTKESMDLLEIVWIIGVLDEPVEVEILELAHQRKFLCEIQVLYLRESANMYLIQKASLNLMKSELRKQTTSISASSSSLKPMTLGVRKQEIANKATVPSKAITPDENSFVFGDRKLAKKTPCDIIFKPTNQTLNLSPEQKTLLNQLYYSATRQTSENHLLYVLDCLSEYFARIPFGQAKSKFYVVLRGHNPGLSDDWLETSQQVNGYANASYFQYNSYHEAMEIEEKNYIISSLIGEDDSDIPVELIDLLQPLPITSSPLFLYKEKGDNKASSSMAVKTNEPSPSQTVEGKDTTNPLADALPKTIDDSLSTCSSHSIKIEDKKSKNQRKRERRAKAKAALEKEEELLKQRQQDKAKAVEKDENRALIKQMLEYQPQLSEKILALETSTVEMRHVHENIKAASTSCAPPTLKSDEDRTTDPEESKARLNKYLVEHKLPNPLKENFGIWPYLMKKNLCRHRQKEVTTVAACDSPKAVSHLMANN
ncbi:hypothetical protein REPUB_Repub16aG0092100 [Reevesia pubescens]